MLSKGLRQLHTLNTNVLLAEYNIICIQAKVTRQYIVSVSASKWFGGGGGTMAAPGPRSIIVDAMGLW